jgi:transposase-like protein
MRVCPYCGKEQWVVKSGKRYNKRGKTQRYLCKKCDKRFIIDKHKKRHFKIEHINIALDLLKKGMTTRAISDHLESVHKCPVSHATIANWKKRYMEEEHDIPN